MRFGKKGRTLGIALSVVVLFIYYILGAVGAATAALRGGLIATLPAPSQLAVSVS